MRFFSDLRLRTSVILLLVGTIFATLALVGSGIVFVMTKRISADNQIRVTNSARQIVNRVEKLLRDIEARVTLAGDVYRDLPLYALGDMLENARQPNLDAIYIIDPAGKLVTASITGYNQERVNELIGIDLSAYPVFRNVVESTKNVWSDKHMSAVTGVITIGVSVPIRDNGGAVIAELPLQSLLDNSYLSQHINDLDYWIVDRNGEVVANSDPTSTEKINVYDQPIVTAGFNGGTLPKTATYRGTTYHVSASISENLGWLFVTRIPAGMANARLREVVSIILIALFGSAIIGAIIAPYWSLGIVRPIRAVAARAELIARGGTPETWPHSSINELNALSNDLSSMASAIVEREDELRHLNEGLEERVSERTQELTKSNRDLSSALKTVEQATNELVQADKLAALGALVAGVAHELNTPIGNGRMAVSSLAIRLARFEKSLADGLRRTELDAFINSVRATIEIAENNMQRASELVGSFKQVSADRTASRRRKFLLREVIDAVLMTLSPTLKNTPIKIDIRVPETIWLDSYPGALGQVFSNLIENAAKHAFAKRETGIIEIISVNETADVATIHVKDNGVGMTKAVLKRAFDPFFTTKMGQGGTGLGLYITHNSVTNILGGTITAQSKVNTGTTFIIVIPLIAPNAPPLENPQD